MLGCSVLGLLVVVFWGIDNWFGGCLWCIGCVGWVVGGVILCFGLWFWVICLE